MLPQNVHASSTCSIGRDSASHGGTAGLGSALANVNAYYRQSQKVDLYLVSKIREIEDHLDTGLDQLSVMEQQVLVNQQILEKT